MYYTDQIREAVQLPIISRGKKKKKKSSLGILKIQF